MPTPESVPPVPTEQVKPSTLPSVSSHISGPVVEVVELIGPDCAIGFARRDFFGEPPGVARIVHRVGIGDSGNKAEIDAAQAQHVLLLLALRLGHDDHGAVAARVTDERQADAGVPGGAFDDDAARAKLAALLGVLDNVERCPVLDRAARVEELGLAEDRAAGLVGGAPQLNQWRVSDGADKAVTDRHALLHTPSSRAKTIEGESGDATLLLFARRG